MVEFVWHKDELDIDAYYYDWSDHYDYSRDYSREYNYDYSDHYKWNIDYRWSDDDTTQKIKDNDDVDNENTFTPTVNINFGEEGGPTDNDAFDLDMKDNAHVDEMLVGAGDISYNPGDDVTVEDLLNEALNGKGNDTGVVVTNTNQLEDNDVASDTYVDNDGWFHQDLKSHGGYSNADDGIAFGGNRLTVDAGDDATVIGDVLAASNASNMTDAFTNELVQGANILNNGVDMTIVGGSLYTDSVGEDDA
ncbi:hypothetical protein [Roseibium sp. MMSF_3544]|uniref:hypothetical protein n=1 Tax=unclassified Roseibium TaxID=2629323 RepID=UPI00273F8437|nr:hypothetical protein [Roseibium sp. MMSF_3544]